MCNNKKERFCLTSLCMREVVELLEILYHPSSGKISLSPYSSEAPKTKYIYLLKNPKENVYTISPTNCSNIFWKFSFQGRKTQRVYISCVTSFIMYHNLNVISLLLALHTFMQYWTNIYNYNIVRFPVKCQSCPKSLSPLYNTIQKMFK